MNSGILSTPFNVPIKGVILDETIFKRILGYYFSHSYILNLGHIYGGDVMTAMIITIGCIIITGMILGYLVWRYKIDDRVIKLDGRIKELESRVDSLHTKVGARKI